MGQSVALPRFAASRADMQIRFYNTLTNQVEDFTPITPGKVKMYSCGPTVYDFAHIGKKSTT